MSLYTKLKRKIARSLFRPYHLHKEYMGEKFDFYVGSFEGSLWYGKHRDRLILDTSTELQWIKDNIQPGDIFADIGAHHGYFALLFSKWVGPAGKVFSIECHPENFQILQRNFALNALENVEAHMLAVGSCKGVINIANDSSGIVRGREVRKGDIQVPLDTLDHYFAEKEIFPTFLKLDIEGGELEALKGMTAILSRRPKLALEVHNFAVPDPVQHIEQIYSFISPYKTAFFQEEPGKPIQPIDLKNRLAELIHCSNPHLYLC